MRTVLLAAQDLTLSIYCQLERRSALRALSGAGVFQTAVDDFDTFSLVKLIAFSTTGALIVDRFNTALRSKSEGFSAFHASFINYMKASILFTPSLEQSQSRITLGTSNISVLFASSNETLTLCKGKDRKTSCTFFLPVEQASRSIRFTSSVEGQVVSVLAIDASVLVVSQTVGNCREGVAVIVD